MGGEARRAERGAHAARGVSSAATARAGPLATRYFQGSISAATGEGHGSVRRRWRRPGSGEPIDGGVLQGRRFWTLGVAAPWRGTLSGALVLSASARRHQIDARRARASACPISPRSAGGTTPADASRSISPPRAQLRSRYLGLASLRPLSAVGGERLGTGGLGAGMAIKDAARLQTARPARLITYRCALLHPRRPQGQTPPRRTPAHPSMSAP